MIQALLAVWVAAQPVQPFVFQNSFWVNLHQRLYVEAGGIDRVGGAGGAGRAGGPGGSDLVEDATWQAALGAYRELATHDLLFDKNNVALNDALGLVPPDATRVDDPRIDPAIRNALNAAAPIYRARLWPRQRAINEAWIAAQKPQVDRHGAALMAKLARAYHTEWPSLPVLVDISGDAGQFGAYTTDGGPQGFAAHATIAPSGEAAAGDMGIESIFHEASHAVDAAIMKAVAAECAAQNVRVPRNLWHAIIFYTVGELVRQELGKAGDAHYMPYAYRFDVYAKGMTKERPALEQDWQPWLDGKVPFEEALRNLVRDATR